MMQIREKQTEQLEEAASKGLKLGGIKKMRTSSKIALVLLILVAFSAIFANFLAPYNPVDIFTARQAPSSAFVFAPRRLCAVNIFWTASNVSSSTICGIPPSTTCPA